jgi:hypothetical protein
MQPPFAVGALLPNDDVFADFLAGLAITTGNLDGVGASS